MVEVIISLLIHFLFHLRVNILINQTGVGFGESLNCGFGLVLDGTEQAANNAINVLFWDVSLDLLII
jgi:urocanate hydratase